MFNSTIPKSLKVAVAAGFISALAFSPLALAAEQGKENLDASASKEITGEVVDMMCYVDHNAIGDKHAGCAAKCIKGGGPVGIVSDGKAYLLVGQHKPMNDQLAEYAGKTITVKGKMAERGGVAPRPPSSVIPSPWCFGARDLAIARNVVQILRDLSSIESSLTFVRDDAVTTLYLTRTLCDRSTPVRCSLA